MRVLVTAKVSAVTPEPSHHTKLLDFLKAYRGWTQYVIDRIWGLNHIPSIKELHHKFYRALRKQGFRAHHCHKIERRAREVVKATKRNDSSKPLLRKLTARLDYQDYKLDINTETLRIAVLNNEWIELKLQWYSYLDKFFGGSWRLGEIYVSLKNGAVSVYFAFKKDVELREPKSVMGVDVNFHTMAYTVLDSDGKPVSMNTLLFRGLRKALHFKKLAEKLQKRYPRSWRFIKWVRRVRARWLRKAKNTLNDSCHLIAKRIVEVAKEHNAVIVLEDLKRLKGKTNGSSRFNWKMQLWTYRRIQSYIHYKALLEGIPVVYVNPRGTSKTSPVGGKLVFINYRWVKLPNGIITTRDIVASWNLTLRYLRMRGSSGWLSPDSSVNDGMTPRPEREKPMQASKVFQIT